LKLGFWCRSLSRYIKHLLKDRRGASSIAIAALISIAILLFYLQFISTVQGAEVAFWSVFGFLKWLAGILGDPHLFDDFEKLIKDLQGTPLWPITVYMLSLAFMSSILYGILWGTKGIVDTTTRILAWRGAKREEKRKIDEENEREHKLWRERLSMIDYPEQPSFESIHSGYHAGQKTLGTSIVNGIGHYGKDVVEELLEQARLTRDRIIQTIGPGHEKSEEQARAFLKKQKEPIKQENKSERDPDTGELLVNYGRPDISTKHYIIECKVGADYEISDSLPQCKNFMQLAERVNKRLLYWFLKHPEPGSKWWPIIHELDECGHIVGYGDE